MFYVGKDEELTIELLEKMIQEYNLNVLPTLTKYKNYYDGKQAILNKTYSDTTKPNCRAVVNYTKNIVDSYAGYMATPSYISYSSDNDITDIMDVMRYNDYQTEDTDLLLNALIYGFAAELMYIDNDGHTRFRMIDSRQCFGIFDNSLTNDLLYFVRIYKASQWTNENTYYVDVYTDTEIRHYKMSGDGGKLELMSVEPHYFSQCPANIFSLPDEKSIFDCILSLQDAVNEIVSSEIDDYSAFCDAYMLLIGATAEEDEIKSMKENRVMILPEGAIAQWLTKSANDTQVENILKRLHDSIYRISQCVDFSSENLMNGVSSGIAIRYKMSGQEHKAGIIEGRMKKALQRRIEIICGIASLKLGEEVYRDISIDFKRNLPQDYTTTIQLINSLKGSVSDATLLQQLPFIDDVNAEIEAVEAQKKRNIELYSFDTHTDNEDDE